MRVGSELKAARKKAGITVEVISKRTKIQVSKLVALEKNDFKHLPTGLYLFSVVRAYAREVRIDPEPIVERLRAEFADKDALDALQALDAAGALHTKNLANTKRSSEEQSNLLRNAAIAAGVVLMAAAGAGAGVYLHNKASNETLSVVRSSPAPAVTAATPVEVLQRPAPAPEPAPAVPPAPTKTRRPKARPAAIQQIDYPIPSPIEDSADSSANIEEVMSEPPVVATAP